MKNQHEPKSVLRLIQNNKKDSETQPNYDGSKSKKIITWTTEKQNKTLHYKIRKRRTAKSNSQCTLKIKKKQPDMSRKREIGSTLQPNTKGVCIILLDNKKDPEPHSPWDWSKSRIFISWATKVQWKSDHNRKRSSLELQKGNKKVEWETIYENSNIPNLHCSPKLQKPLVSTRVERESEIDRENQDTKTQHEPKSVLILLQNKKKDPDPQPNYNGSKSRISITWANKVKKKTFHSKTMKEKHQCFELAVYSTAEIQKLDETKAPRERKRERGRRQKTDENGVFIL